MKTANAFAFDRASVRHVDQDGHLHIDQSIVSRAQVNPYRGAEIPNFQALGLDPDKIYQLLRDPKELEKAAPSLNGKPLLFKHKPVDANDHPKEIVVGAASNPAFEAGDIKAELVVWPSEAIKAIDDETQKDLSAGYRYVAVMTPGTFEGTPYDGVMTEIQFNHVALVEVGRVKGAVVGDAAINLHKEPLDMHIKLTRKGAVAQGALLAYLAPIMAQDAKIDLTPILKGVTAKNFKASKPAILSGLKSASTGKIAQDAALDLEAVGKVLEALEDVTPVEDEDPAEPKDPALDAEGLSAEEEAKYQELLKRRKPGAEDADETPEEKKAREDKEAKEKADKEAKEKDMVTKPAMDAAIAAATKLAHDAAAKTQREIREAEKFVAPWVGEMIAQDSAEGVYRTAALALKIPEADTVHASALKTLIGMVPKPGEQRDGVPQRRMAQDSAATAESEFKKMFPDSVSPLHL